MSELTREEIERSRLDGLRGDFTDEKTNRLCDAARAYLDLRDGVRELAHDHETRPGRIHGDFARELRALLGEDQ